MRLRLFIPGIPIFNGSKMVLASYHVIRDVLEIIESSDMEKLQDMCAKFCKRYPEDEEFRKIICGAVSKLSEYMLSRDETVLGDIKSELRELMNIRKMETSGGDRLWYKDRRP